MLAHPQESQNFPLFNEGEKLENSCERNQNNFLKVGGVAQVVEYLPSKPGALSSNPHHAKNEHKYFSQY
jgi:hypothetical protein